MSNTTHAAGAIPAFDRILRFEAIHNVRDLGGVPTATGGLTRSGVALRAASLLGATAADRTRLQALGVERVFDLRAVPEIAREGFLDLSEIGIEREHVPIFRDTDISPEALIARRKLYASDFSQVYLIMLRDGAPAIRRIVAGIAEARGPVLFHCAGGKDRTGVVSAVLLLLAGVEAEQIAADYALTSEHLPPPSEERIVASMERMGLDRFEFMELLSARPQAMLRTLERLLGEFGTVEQYLQAIGTPNSAITGARTRLTAPPAE